MLDIVVPPLLSGLTFGLLVTGAATAFIELEQESFFWVFLGCYWLMNVSSSVASFLPRTFGVAISWLIITGLGLFLLLLRINWALDVIGLVLTTLFSLAFMWFPLEASIASTPRNLVTAPPSHFVSTVFQFLGAMFVACLNWITTSVITVTTTALVIALSGTAMAIQLMFLSRRISPRNTTSIMEVETIELASVEATPTTHSEALRAFGEDSPTTIEEDDDNNSTSSRLQISTAEPDSNKGTFANVMKNTGLLSVFLLIALGPLGVGCSFFPLVRVLMPKSPFPVILITIGSFSARLLYPFLRRRSLLFSCMFAMITSAAFIVGMMGLNANLAVSLLCSFLFGFAFGGQLSLLPNVVSDVERYSGSPFSPHKHVSARKMVFGVLYLCAAGGAAVAIVNIYRILSTFIVGQDCDSYCRTALFMFATISSWCAAAVGLLLHIRHHYQHSIRSFIGGAPSPESSANLLSLVTINWLTPLLLLGTRRPLQSTDMYQLPKGYTSKVVHAEFASHWMQQQSLSNPSLPAAIIQTFGKRWLLVGGGCRLLADVCQLSLPIVLRTIIQFLTDSEDCTLIPESCPSVYTGYGLGLLLMVLLTVATISVQYHFHVVMSIGLAARSTLISAVFAKSLKLSSKSRINFPPGKILNLASIDASRMDMSSGYLHYLWSIPLQITVICSLLFLLLGPAAFAGITVLVAASPLQSMLVRKITEWKKKLVSNTDERIKVLEEMLQGIRTIKLFAWEDIYRDKMKKIRNRELGFIRSLRYAEAALATITLTSPTLCSLAAIILYSFFGNELHASILFPALALFNALRTPLAMLPTMVTTVLDTKISLQRLQEYLICEELKDQPNYVHRSPHAIRIDGGCFVWELPKPMPVVPSTSLFSRILSSFSPASKPEEVVTAPTPTAWDNVTLREINLEVEKGELTMIFGAVGAGKSSLISALVGEIRKIRGQVTICGSVGYCPQQPWIKNASVKENILFEKELDLCKYAAVVKAAQLTEDLKILPNGDDTEIGEKGINLSGGQKQRISLARLMYFDPDVAILDDPLSAVDPHVARSLVDECINGILKSKTRILVSHQLHFASMADHIIVMAEGQIQSQGTFSSLMQENGYFANLMRTHGGEHRDIEDYSPGRGDAVHEHSEGNTNTNNTNITNTNGNSLDDSYTNGNGDDDDGLDPMTEFIRTISAEAVSVEDIPDILRKQGSTEVKHHKKVPLIDEKPSVAAKKETSGLLMTQEEQQVGSVQLGVYCSYIHRAGGLRVAAMILLLFPISQIVRVGSDFWLADWMTGKYDLSLHGYTLVYFILGISAAALFMFSTLIVAFASISASRKFHQLAFLRILRAPISFFDTTPLGRILNRFSKDVDAIDNSLAFSVRSALATFSSSIATIGLISISSPIFLFFIAPILALFSKVQNFYRSSSREIKRIDSVLRSPLYAHITETLTGLATIRAFKKQKSCLEAHGDKLDSQAAAYFVQLSAQRWIGVRLDMIGNLVVGISAMLMMYTKDSLSPAVIGVVLANSLQITNAMTWCIRNLTETEVQMNAVERINYYARHVPMEAPEIVPTKEIPKHWPRRGDIKVENMCLRYREGLPMVLNNISFKVHAGDKVAIVGKTGSGKSSIMQALLRMVEPCGGKIYIDDINILKIGLTTLRHAVAIIPQDPVLFTGTIRSNLDPFNQIADDKIWDALLSTGLESVVREMPDQLSSVIAAGGENLSVGQRQLMCLARAMLRRCHVMIMDEATANVDLETDAVIQKTIRKEFSRCTVLTIAHRINTIIDYDKVMVLADGSILEYDTPASLLSKSSSMFHSMVQATGHRNAKALHKLAQNAGVLRAASNRREA